MDKNIKLYGWYFAASSFLAWMPVFFLYFSERLSLSEVLQLEAIYYISVVVLEVPSGYFSDRIGRQKTLLYGSIFLCLAISLYIHSVNFWWLCAGQIAFAAHMAFVSGTNTVFHFESLKCKKLEAEYGPREAKVNKWALISGGFGALLGGWLSGFEIIYAYWLSLIAAIAAFSITLQFQEPYQNEKTKAASNLLSQLSGSLKYLKNKSLLWLFSLYVIMYVMVHVPYEFYQPYLKLLEEGKLLNLSSAPVMSGVLYAIAMFIGAYAASQSIHWKNNIGLNRYLMIMFVMIMIVIGLMSWLLHPVLIVMIMFRSFGWSGVKAPLFEVITPQIDAGHRATFHSMMSLISRLGFFGLLFGLSIVTPSGESSNWIQLSFLLKICFGLGIIGGVLLLFSSRSLLKNTNFNAIND
jgi:MFS family permease